MENFGPYIDEFILSFPENSLVLVTGPNGIGKTISLDAISFTFYGITSKGERGDDVVNNETEKNCHTWVKFDDSDGNTYVADRYHKHSKFRNTVHLTKNGEPKPYKVGHREVSKEIECLICDRVAFTNTLAFGQKVKDFFTDLADTDQKAIFWKLLDLLRYDYFQKRAKEMLKEEGQKFQDTSNQIVIAESLIETLEKQIQAELDKSVEYDKNKALSITNLKDNITKLEAELVTRESELNKFPEVDITSLIEEKASIKAKIDNAGADALQIKKNVESEVFKKANELTKAADNEKSKIDAEIDKQLNVITANRKEVNDNYDIEKEKLREKDTELQILKKTKESTILNLKNQINDLANVKLVEGSTCPTCLEPITKNSFKHIAEMSLDLLNKRKDVKFEIVGVISQKIQGVADLTTELFRMKTIKDSEFDKQIADLEKRRNDETSVVDGRLKTVKDQLAEMANKTMREQLASLEDQAREMQTKLVNIEEQLKTGKEQAENRQTIQNNITDCKNKSKIASDKIKQLAEEEFETDNLELLKNDKFKKLEIIQRSEGSLLTIKKRIAILEFWKEAYSPKGIPSMLIDEAIPSMNKFMKKYLDQLSNGRYIVTFDTLSQIKTGEYRDKFSVNVLDTKTQVNNRKQLSGGQTRLIDVATILTLRDVKTSFGNVDFNLFIFDEIFDALDDSNIGYVCNILNSLKEDRSIYVVSHRLQDQLEADQTIQLT